jgi:hypothetical protein
VLKWRYLTCRVVPPARVEGIINIAQYLNPNPTSLHRPYHRRLCLHVLNHLVAVRPSVKVGVYQLVEVVIGTSGVDEGFEIAQPRPRGVEDEPSDLRLALHVVLEALALEPVDDDRLGLDAEDALCESGHGEELTCPERRDLIYIVKVTRIFARKTCKLHSKSDLEEASYPDLGEEEVKLLDVAAVNQFLGSHKRRGSAVLSGLSTLSLSLSIQPLGAHLDEHVNSLLHGV